MNEQPNRLILLRHAKSDRSLDVTDHERPLAQRGEREAPQAGRWLDEHVASVDLVLCSTATRARRTCELVTEQFSADTPIRHDGRLYGASGQELLDRIRELPEELENVLFVGHNPGLEELLTVLTGDYQELKTSAIAVLRPTGSWREANPGWARLESLIAARP